MSTRNGYEQQIAKLESSHGNERKIKELEDLLHRACVDDEPLEKEVQLLERKAIKDSEQAKWDAIREVTLSFCSRTPSKLTSHPVRREVGNPRSGIRAGSPGIAVTPTIPRQEVRGCTRDSGDQSCCSKGPR